MEKLVIHIDHLSRKEFGRFINFCNPRVRYMPLAEIVKLWNNACKYVENTVWLTKQTTSYVSLSCVPLGE